MCVTIVLNDDAHGQFSFDSSSVSVTIEESGEISTSANGIYQFFCSKLLAVY